MIRFCLCLSSIIVLATWAAANAVSQQVEEAIVLPASVYRAESDRISAISKAMPATISVLDPSGQGGGSGVVISPSGLAITNFHVAQPTGTYLPCTLPDGKVYDAVLVGLDPTGDVAMIQLLGRDDFPAAEMADSDDVRVGDWCFAIGNPFLLATNMQPTVTYGMISGIHRYQYPSNTLLEYTNCFQTDASINPGNSGGPLFDAKGCLIGINGRISIEKRGRVNVGVGYAISINQVKHFLGYLRSGRIVDHATLGATVATDDEGRVVVTDILDSCDAYRRGLRFEDEIISLGGHEIDTANTFKNVLGIFPRGWRIPLSYIRDGQRHDILVRLEGLHSRQRLIDMVKNHVTDPKDKPKGKPKDPRPKKTKRDDAKRPLGPPDGTDKGKLEKPPASEKKPPGHGMPRGPVLEVAAPKKPLPPEVAKRFVEKEGYANYFYNLKNRTRVWQGLQRGGSLLGQRDEWLLRGKTRGGLVGDGGDFEFLLRDGEAFGTLPDGQSHVSLADNLETQVAPEKSGGLLLGLALWRRLLVEGPEQFGDVYYLGTAPLAGQEELVDVLVATFDVTETYFYSDPRTGRLLAMEVYPDLDVDPCEIVFFGQLPVSWGGIEATLPARLEIRFGDTHFGVFELEQFSLPTSEDEGV